MKLTQAYITQVEEKLTDLIKLNRKREALYKELIESCRAKLAGIQYKGTYIKTITKADLHEFDYHLHEAIGQPRSSDIGKQVYKQGEVYCVESNEQRDKRLQHEKENT